MIKKIVLSISAVCFVFFSISVSPVYSADEEVRVSRGNGSQSKTKEESKKQASLQQNQPQQQNEQKKDQILQKPKKVPVEQKDSMKSTQ